MTGDTEGGRRAGGGCALAANGPRQPGRDGAVRRRMRGGTTAWVLVLLSAAAVALAVGYWLGQRGGHAAHAQADGAAPAAESSGRRILYYRNPMGLPDTSPVPKKDSMGMDYIPVYEGEDEPGSGIRVSNEKIQKLGVRVAPVQIRRIDATVRASGRVEVDERRLATITPRFEGYVERLHVNATGQAVARGEPLFDAFSPDLLAAQREYAIAAQGLAHLKGSDEQTRAGMQRLAQAALERLRNWDVDAQELARLAGGGEPRRVLTFRAPVAGVVLERRATLGMRFMPGEVLYQIADLSSVWLIADVFEQDIGRVRVGQPAVVRLDAWPGETFEGRVGYVYPTLRAETRSAQVRIELPNRGGRIKPAMYAQVELPAAGREVLAVPNDAVIDSGTRRVVLVDLGEGRFEPREVVLGARGDAFVEVRDGLKAGESVVVAANFLLDSESNLRAALGVLTGGANAGGRREVVHEAVGTLDEIDPKTGLLLITHEPVASLNWPRMTMEFVPANESLAKQTRPGAPIRFEFVERKPGEWVVTKMEPRK
jgi:RND family efflux transporter MFP subunit